MLKREKYQSISRSVGSFKACLCKVLGTCCPAHGVPVSGIGEQSCSKETQSLNALCLHQCITHAVCTEV